jgi:hypothetical protein
MAGMLGRVDLVEILRDNAWAGVGSIATGLAVIVALGAIVIDRRSQAASGRQAQARAVSGWITETHADLEATDYGNGGQGWSEARLLNASAEPVYRVIVWLIRYPDAARGEDVAHDSEPALLSVLPPGTFEVMLPAFEPGMYRRAMVEIAFTDAAGRHWIRRLDGHLEQVKQEPRHHYGMDEPLDWRIAHHPVVPKRDGG